MNDNELEKMVLETYRISKENREMLRRIEGRQKIAQMGKYLKAAVALAVLVVGYIYLAPHWAEIQAAFQTAQGAAQSLQAAIPAKPAQ